MNIVNAGSRFQIFGEDVKTFHDLPIQCFDVCFHPMQGFWLQTHEDFTVNEDKVYGTQAQKTDKVLSAYESSNRNLGIILSGPKGIGKSLFARVLIQKSLEKLLPVIIVSQYFPGIADFLGSIKQRAVVLFDEFEKTFARDSENDPQVEMLPLFDGVDSGSKLFVITCNDYNKLNEFLLNRPGRFHYHFTMTTPNFEEIQEYLADKVSEQYHGFIDEVAHFAVQADLTYDSLRAIAFELNRGYSIKETLNDLNIMKIESIFYRVEVEFANGQVATNCGNSNIDFYSQTATSVRLHYLDEDETFLNFVPVNAKLDFMTNKFILLPADAKIRTRYDYFDNKPSDEMIKQLDSMPIVRIEFSRIRNKEDRYLI